MLSRTFFGPVALLYYGCIALLVGLVLCIALRSSRRTHARPQLRDAFVLLGISLLAWVVTLFLEVRTGLQGAQLWLGRANFAAVAFAAYYALRFVRETSAKRPTRSTPWSSLLLVETALLAAVTLLTPLVSAAERVEAGHAVTTFGRLFAFYLAHVLGCLGAAVTLALRERRRAQDRAVRAQLTLIGLGMLATGCVATVTNALLPFCFGYFGLCEVGVLSTIVFAMAVAQAVFFHRLFNLRLIVRETLVYGLLLAFVLGAYSSAVFVISQHLTTSADKATQLVVLFIAFSFDPVRRFLEERTDRLLFGDRAADRGDARPGKRKADSRLTLALLFPWRRQ